MSVYALKRIDGALKDSFAYRYPVNSRSVSLKGDEQWLLSYDGESKVQLFITQISIIVGVGYGYRSTVLWGLLVAGLCQIERWLRHRRL